MQPLSSSQWAVINVYVYLHTGKSCIPIFACQDNNGVQKVCQKHPSYNFHFHFNYKENSAITTSPFLPILICKIFLHLTTLTTLETKHI